MFYENNGRLEFGSDLPNETSIQCEILDVTLVASVQKDRGTGPAKVVLIDQIAERKCLRIGEVEMI